MLCISTDYILTEIIFFANCHRSLSFQTKHDVLYSFLGVNNTFDQIVRDVIYTRSGELINNHSKTDNYSLPDPILDRFCSQILPQIHQNIRCLTLEPLSMERILHVGEYLHLWKLTLIKLDQESALLYFTGKKSLDR